jgi:hypothetical protein
MLKLDANTLVVDLMVLMLPLMGSGHSSYVDCMFATLQLSPLHPFLHLEIFIAFAKDCYDFFRAPFKYEFGI